MLESSKMNNADTNRGDFCSTLAVMKTHNLQALVWNILPPTPAIIGYVPWVYKLMHDTHVHTHTCTHTHTCMDTHSYMHTHMHTHTHTHAWTHTHTCTHTHTHTHQTHAHHTHTVCTHTHIHSCTHTHTVYTHTHQTHTTHACMHTHAHTYTHTHTHTHIFADAFREQAFKVRGRLGVTSSVEFGLYNYL